MHAAVAMCGPDVHAHVSSLSAAHDDRTIDGHHGWINQASMDYRVRKDRFQRTEWSMCMIDVSFSLPQNIKTFHRI